MFNRGGGGGGGGGGADGSGRDEGVESQSIDAGNDGWCQTAFWC